MEAKIILLCVCHGVFFAVPPLTSTSEGDETTISTTLDLEILSTLIIFLSLTYSYTHLFSYCS